MNLQDLLSEKLGIRIISMTTMPGDNIGTSYRVRRQDKSKIFVKTYPEHLRGMIEPEVEGLQALADTGAVRVPKILGHCEDFLALEWIDNHDPSKLSLERLGHAMGALHKNSSTLFGFSTDNYLGGTPQPNDWEGNGATFYRVKRFGHMLKLLRRSGKLDAEQGPLDRLVARLDEFLPNETPSLIHGDFWAGNVLIGPDEQPYLVDPATYYGYREADLAMSQLFGGFDKVFYSAYHEAYPIDTEGYKVRKELFDLYHLLNHASVFGGGYLQRAIEAARGLVG